LRMTSGSYPNNRIGECQNSPEMFRPPPTLRPVKPGCFKIKMYSIEYKFSNNEKQKNVFCSGNKNTVPLQLCMSFAAALCCCRAVHVVLIELHQIVALKT